MANKTVQELYTAADSLMRQEGNSSGVPGLEQAQVILWINDLHKQFFDEFLAVGRNYPAYMKREKGYTGVSGTHLAAAVSSGATTFTVNSSSALDTAGAGVIYRNNQYDIFLHTGNSAGTVSGVTLVDFDHDANEQVSKLYALPSNFGRMRIEKDPLYRGEGVRVNGKGHFESADMPARAEFSLWQDPSTAAWYLWMPKNQSGDILVTYDKKPTELTATSGASGTTDIPSNLPDHWYIIHGLVGIFKHCLDDTYVPTAERMKQDEVLQRAFTRTSSGKKISASDHFFSRYA